MRVHHAQTDHPDPYSLPPGYGEACEVSTRRLFPWSFASMSKGPIRRCVRVATSRTSKTVIGLVWVAQMASPTKGAYPHDNSMSAHTTHSAGDFSESKISSKNKSLNLYTDYSHALSLVQLPVARTNDTSLVISANSQRARGSSNECCCLKKIALKSAMQNA